MTNDECLMLESLRSILYKIDRNYYSFLDVQRSIFDVN